MQTKINVQTCVYSTESVSRHLSFKLPSSIKCR